MKYKLTFHALLSKLRGTIPALKRFARGANVTITFLASLVTVLGVIFLFVNFPQFSQFFNKSFRTDRYWEDRLNALNVQVNLGTFEDILGKPTLTNPLTRDRTFKEHIFVNERFFVTTITDPSDKIQAYSITTRTAAFKPYIKGSNVTLGKSVFSSLGTDPDLTGGNVDHDNFMYEEMYYRGKDAGKELTYLYGAPKASAATNITDRDIPRPFWRDVSAIIAENCDQVSDFYRNFPTQTTLSSNSFGDIQLAHRDKALITSAGFFSPYPRFLCHIANDEWGLPPFAPDNNQVRLLKP